MESKQAIDTALWLTRALLIRFNNASCVSDSALTMMIAKMYHSIYQIMAKFMNLTKQILNAKRDNEALNPSFIAFILHEANW